MHASWACCTQRRLIVIVRGRFERLSPAVSLLFEGAAAVSCRSLTAQVLVVIISTHLVWLCCEQRALYLDPCVDIGCLGSLQARAITHITPMHSACTSRSRCSLRRLIACDRCLNILQETKHHNLWVRPTAV